MLPSSTQNPNALEIKALGKKGNKNSNEKKSGGNKIATMDKKNLRLFTANDDLKRNWFIEYYEFKGPVKIRKQVKGGINRGKTIEERKRIAAEIIADLLNNTGLSVLLPVGQNTLKVDLDNIMVAHCADLRKKTRQAYQSKVKIFLQWCHLSGVFYLHQLSLQKAQDFFTHLKQDKKLHNSTIENYREKLKTLFFELVGDDNPFKKIKHFASVPTPARPYQKHEIEILKNYISVQDPQLWLFIQFIIYCLIRPNSELRLLKIHHIDFENSIILIPADIAKNKKSQWVTIPKTLMNQLDFLKEYSPNCFIFSKKGLPGPTPLGYNAFYLRHKKVLIELNMNIKGYNLYSYKHFGAVSMARQNVPLLEIKEQGRWHSLDQMTDYLKAFGVKDCKTIQNIELL